MKKLLKKDGSPTAYAYACGYVSRVNIGDVSMTLYKDGCWHVRATDSRSRLFWDAFPSLGQARKRFNSAKRELEATR